jgi:hypothetical protein
MKIGEQSLTILLEWWQYQIRWEYMGRSWLMSRYVKKSYDLSRTNLII